MQQPGKLIEMPEFGEGDILFTLKDVTYTPDRPRLKVPFAVKGKLELFKIPFLAPIWVRAKVTYPEAFWEEIIPIIGAPTVIESDVAIGSDFEINFPRGFDREGEFVLDVEAYAGPTFSVAKMTIPPFPPVTSYQTTFIVAGEVPPEEVGFRNFRILSYSKNGGPPVTPPGALELEVGDRCRVNVGFDHMDGAVTGMFHAAIWKKTLIDPHDEQLNADKAFTVPSSTDWEPREGYIDIIITSAIRPGSEYGLYVKIMGITGGDIFTEYLENVITIIGPPPEADIADFGFQLTKGTYDIGAKVPFTAGYKYKGKTQGGQLTISIGTGVTPSFFTKHTYAPVPVEFLEAADWEERGLEGSITLPDVLEAGQTYSVRAKLETLEVKAQETGTEYGAITITGMETLEVRIDPVGAGYVTTSPAPSGGTQHNWLFPYGTTVYVTAHPASGYVFESWSGEMTDTTAITAPVYPMTEHRGITAHFKAEVVIPPADIADWNFVATGGTYNLGDSVPFTASYKYKGKAQGGWLTISLGTGVSPSFSTKYTFPQRAVSFSQAMDWTTGYLSGSFTLPTTLVPGQTYSVRAKLETADGVQETDTDWGVLTIKEVVVGISFSISIWGIPPDFGNYDKWCCYYWDPGISNFVGDGKWYYPYLKIPFSNVKSGGYLAVFLMRDSTTSDQYTSPTFGAVNGGIYQYDVELGRVSKIG